MRAPMPGDASVIRSYERLVRPDGETALLMISPPRPVGPPVRRGRPYTTIAKLAETVHAFVAMDKGLRAQGLSAPLIYGEDLEAGLLIVEDLGSEPVVDAAGPSPSAMRKQPASSPSSTPRACRGPSRRRRAATTRSRPTISKRC